MRLILLSCLAALPAFAQTPMTGEAFDRYSRGKTFYYADGGTTYGAEQYMPDRRVIWAFKGQECTRGIWYEQDGRICFVYENNPTPQCWDFYLGPDGLRAHFAGDPDGSELVEVDQSSEPLTCAGPDVGV